MDMESPDYLCVHPAGALSPSLWNDEDDWKKPDVLNNHVNLGSPQSPFARSNSLDGSLFPNDDALTWMEKSCDLESLTELCDVSVQDVAAFDKQATNAIIKDGGAITPDVLQVDGVEDLLHDYIDPEVYMVKEERRSSIESCLSIGDGIEDIIFSATRDHAGKDNTLLDNTQGWNSRIDQRIIHQEPAPPPKPTNVGFQSKTRPILPKTNGFQAVHPVQVVSKPKAPQTIKVLPVSTQQEQLLLKNPLIVNAKTISVKPASNKVINPRGNTIQTGRVQKTARIQKAARNVSIHNFLNALTRQENLAPLQALLDESNRLIYSSDTPVVNSVTISPNPSMQPGDVLVEPIVSPVSSPVQSVEVFAEPTISPVSSPTQPLEVFTEPIITSVSSPIQSLEVFTEPIITPTPVRSPTQSLEVFTEPIITPVSSPTQSREVFTKNIISPVIKSPKSVEGYTEPVSRTTGNPPIEVITCDSILGNREINLEDSTINLEDIIVTPYSDLPVPSPNFEVLDYTENASPNESLSQISETYSDNSPGDSSFSGYEDCPALSPFRSKPYSRQTNTPKKVGRRSKNLPAEEKKNRKKVQNKEAAIRYRQKKRDEYDLFLQEENELIEKNKKLESQKDSIMMEIKYLKGLMLDLYKAKGLIN